MRNVLMLCSLLLSAAPVCADPITVKFEGDVSDCHLCLPEWKVDIGSKLKGLFSFDPDAIDVLPDDPLMGIYTSALPMSVSAGKLDFTSPTTQIVIQNAGSEGYRVNGSLFNDQNLPIALWGFTLAGSVKDVFQGDQLVPPPDLENFVIAGFVLTVFTSYGVPPTSHTWADISGNLTELDAKQVPEPAAWMIMLAGLVTLRWRQKMTLK